MREWQAFSSSSAQSGKTRTGVTFADALRVWAKIGLMSFGGPGGQIALMYRILVDEKKWISESRFLHALLSPARKTALIGAVCW